MMYRYQMHTHTLPCSHCAKMEPEALCRALCEGGYAGAVLTNHFLHGNTGIDRTLSWEDFVSAYIADYEACRAAAAAYDLDILFGIEEGVGGGVEILCYGLCPDVLLRHPELRERSITRWREVLSAEGVLIVQAHPYRDRSYITAVGPLDSALIDGVEVYNRGNHREEDVKAAAFAKANPALLITSGADAHACAEVAVGGIETPHRIRTEGELAAVLRRRDYKLILPDGLDLM